MRSVFAIILSAPSANNYWAWQANKREKSISFGFPPRLWKKKRLLLIIAVIPVEKYEKQLCLFPILTDSSSTKNTCELGKRNSHAKCEVWMTKKFPRLGRKTFLRTVNVYSPDWYNKKFLAFETWTAIMEFLPPVGDLVGPRQMPPSVDRSCRNFDMSKCATNFTRKMSKRQEAKYVNIAADTHIRRDFQTRFNVTFAKNSLVFVKQLPND